MYSRTTVFLCGCGVGVCVIDVCARARKCIPRGGDTCSRIYDSIAVAFVAALTLFDPHEREVHPLTLGALELYSPVSGDLWIAATVLFAIRAELEAVFFDAATVLEFYPMFVSTFRRRCAFGTFL